MAAVVSSTLPTAGDASGASVSATATVVAPRRIFLTGNSMTDGVRYTGLAELLGRGGAAVSLGRQSGSGYPQAYNLNLKAGYYTSGIDPARPTDSNPWGNYQQAFAGTWDTLTLQPHDRRLLNDYSGGPGANEADVPMTIAFMQRLAANSPGAQVFAYSRPARRTDVDAGNKPTGLPFDYAAEWLKTYVDSGAGLNSNFITRSYVKQFMPLARSAQQADATAKSMKPLRLIPVGEAYYNIDQMIKAGRFAGTHLTSMKTLYTDQSHPTATASYVIALTFHASITGNDPRGVAPTSNYLNAAPALADAKVQALIQQAVYDAITYTGYTGWTVPMPAAGEPTGAIGGTMFNDLDADGVRDGGEPTLSNWKVFIDADKDGVHDAGEPTTFTDSTGGYRFTALTAGSYRVRAAINAGWRQTTPSSGYVDVTLAGGQDAAGRNFGATQKAKLSGTLWNDLDADAVRDAGEAGLANWTVYLDADKDGVLDATERSVTTGSSGTYVFDNLATGNLRVRALQPAGWRRTTSVMYYDQTLAAGATASNKNFAYTQKVLIGGSVFNDLDGDGVRDAGEAGLGAWRVFIDSDGDGVLDAGEISTLSDAAGVYSFKTLSAGTYKLRVVQKSGWTRTTPTMGYHSVTLASGGQSTGRLFGQRKIA